MSLNTWSLNVSLHNNKLTQANTAFSSYFETGLFRELWCERAWLWGTWVSLCCLEVLQTVNDTDLSVSMFVCNTAQGSMLNASIQCYWSRTDTSIGINTTTHNHMCPRDAVWRAIRCLCMRRRGHRRFTETLQQHHQLTWKLWWFTSVVFLQKHVTKLAPPVLWALSFLSSSWILVLLFLHTADISWLLPWWPHEAFWSLDWKRFITQSFPTQASVLPSGGQTCEVQREATNETASATFIYNIL